MNVEVFNCQGVHVGAIRERELFAFVHTDELNGEDSVSITTLFPLSQGYRLLWKDEEGNYHEHVCQNPRVARELGTPIYSDVAINSICEMFGNIVEDCSVSDRSVRKIFEQIISYTRFTGHCEVDATVPLATYFSQKNARECIRELLKFAGGELKTHIKTNEYGVASRECSIVKNRGNQNGHKRFTYGKDLLKVERTEHAGVITACYGYGKKAPIEKRVLTKNGDPVYYEVPPEKMERKKLTFASVNDGKSYVVDEDALKTYGLSSSKDGERRNIFGVYENSNIDDPSELKKETLKYLHAHSKPRVSYSVDVVDLASYGREWERVDVGDAVNIVDTCFNPVLRAHGRVTKIVRDYITKTANVTLGNIAQTLTDTYTYQQEQIQELGARVDNFNPVLATNKDNINDFISVLNRKFNEDGAGCFHIDPMTGKLTTKGMSATSCEVDGTIRSFVPSSDTHTTMKDGVISGFSDKGEKSTPTSSINFNSNSDAGHGLQIKTAGALTLDAQSIYVPMHGKYEKLYTGDISLTTRNADGEARVCKLKVCNGLIIAVTQDRSTL